MCPFNLEGLALGQPDAMHRYKKRPVIKARVESRIWREIEANEARPPRLVNELLSCEEVDRFCCPETRGPQVPAGPPRLFEPLPLDDVAEEPSNGASVAAILLFIVFLAGVAVGGML